jgi:CRISPR-associated protein Cas1
MARNYYIFNPGRLSRKQHTIFFTRYRSKSDAETIADFEERLEKEPQLIDSEPDIDYEETAEKKVIPVEDIDSIYIFGEADFNRKFFNFCGSKGIPIHIFNYFGFYSGTFYPREFLNSGELLVRQVRAYDNPHERLFLARQFTLGASANMLRNLQYYHNRGKSLQNYLDSITALREELKKVSSIEELMGIEGNIRQWYYSAWPEIIEQEIEFERRTKHPPDNLINAMISFGNSLVYTTCLSEIYRTQLSPLISYLHEPGTKRFSLSLDIAEIFKPLLADRLIFTLLNKRQITQKKHVTLKGKICWLNEEGRKLFIKEFDERLSTTIKHRKIGRNVSYRRLIRLECYKLIKHLMGQENYRPFELWW